MNGLGPRAVLVPDLGDDLAVAIGALERLFLALRAAEEDGAALAPPLAGGAALAALRRLWRAVAPTQGRQGPPPAGRLYAHGGRPELVPLRLVDVDPVDVATLSAAAAALGRGANGAGPVRRALEESGGDPPGTDLVVAAAGFSGLLDLADTGESIVLRERLAAAGPGVDVVLSPVQESAYRATVERLTAMWPTRRPGPPPPSGGGRRSPAGS
ncbi:hypothetical protein [Nonomuraea roseoviolacea]|uniref:Uncharacterized protein n=1 Tax=Nonomuraea roseoviolacea subsp. carminata TaxID=160689 RepID=A0ABT1JTA5_9ACTN|nr:hypothetical protein [Nonomuraea roseoviolacea]MCP2344511.1 hypothetical protein [Nonomuraea roseoviolacea subsp. carminata]